MYRHLRHVVSLAACGVLLPACAGPREGGAGDTAAPATTEAASGGAASFAADVEAEARAIRALRDAQERAVAARDTDAVVAIYADDVVHLAGGSPAETGRAAVRRLWGNGLRAPVAVAYTPVTLDVGRGGDLAVERGTVRITGAPGKPEEGNYVYVWKKRAGRWQVTLWSFATRD